MECQVSKRGIQNLIDFCQQNQNTQQKLLYFVNRNSAETCKKCLNLTVKVNLNISDFNLIQNLDRRPSFVTDNKPGNL